MGSRAILTATPGPPAREHRPELLQPLLASDYCKNEVIV
jgi:hypothetical protein